jgi:peptide/nickel transport system substrate-binding protein
MNRRDHVVVAALVLLLVGLGGILALPRMPAADEAATPSPDLTMPPPVTYREGVVGRPESITPITARSRSERTLVGLVFSGLVRLGPADTLEPDLAESWTTDESGRIWTFRLRDDATWHDGTPVTAEDVVFTIDALRSPDAAGAMAGSWADVEARAIDDRTVQLTLQTPVAGFLAAMTQPLLPAHLLAGVPFAELGSDAFASRPVGSGPFALVELDDEQAVLVPAAMVEPRDEPEPSGSLDPFGTPVPLATSSRPVPYVERLVVRFYDDAASLASALESGDVDAVTGLPADVAAVLASADGVEALRYPTTTLSSVLLDLRPSHSELADVRVRRALLAAIDRDAIVESVLGGSGSRADALVPPTSWAFDADAAGSVKYDPKKAAELLKEAGWKKSEGAWTAPRGKEPYRVELLTVPADASPRLAATAEAVRDAWTKLGLKVDLVSVPGADMAERLREGSFTAAVVDVAMGLEPDLYPLLASSQVRTSGSNLSGFQDPALDALLEKARVPGTPEERTAAWKALLAGLAERQPILPLAWPDEVALVRGVEGMSPRLIANPGDRFWDVLGWRLATDR